MALTNAGVNLIASLLIGGAGTVFSNANAYIGVGDGTGSFATTQTDLLGTNKFRNPMDGGFPTISSNVLVFQSTFATGNANFNWNEWGVFNNSSGGTMLNRVQETLGTKASTQAWQFNVTLTVSTP